MTIVTPGVAPWEAVGQIASRGVPFAVATVVRTQGSTPQTIGARLVVTADPEERPSGTLGGGCVEADAIECARAVIASGERVLRTHQLSEELAWNTGLVCGGTMWILAETGADAFTCGGQDVLPLVQAASRGGMPLAFVTSFVRGGRQALAFASRLVVLADGRRFGTLGDPASDAHAGAVALERLRLGTPGLAPNGADGELLVEPVVGRPRLVVAGGGHVAKAIARQALLLDFDVTVLEDRPEFADPDRFGGATVLGGPVPESIASIEYGPQSYLVVATRGHKLDADCVMAAVRTPVPYIGLLGSRRKTALVHDMLREAGVASDRIAIVRAPVGLDLGGRTPAEIALSVLAEIVGLRHGGSGRPLSGRAG